MRSLKLAKDLLGGWRWLLGLNSVKALADGKLDDTMD